MNGDHVCPVSWEDMSRTAPPLLVVISGPSGVGKDAAIEQLKRKDRPWHFVITATTRVPRPGERDGVDYIFLDEGTFLEMRSEGQLLESAQYSGSWYGVPLSQVQDGLSDGKDVFLKIDVQGAETVRELAADALFIFLAPGSFEELEGRLGSRQTEGPVETQRRLELAREELAQVGKYDYCVINRDGELEQAVADIEAIITAEKRRVTPRVVKLG